MNTKTGYLHFNKVFPTELDVCFALETVVHEVSEDKLFLKYSIQHYHYLKG